MTTVAGAGARRRPFVLELPAVACTVVLLAVAFCVVYPLLLVVLESFQVAPPGQPANCGLVGRGPFDIYSFWGIVWIHVITGSLTVKVILLTPAFRNMNAAFEEASRVAGASTARTALSITVPVMAPVVLSVLLLGTMVSL